MTGEQIKTLRKQLGLSRKRLAAELGIAPERVADWELERRFPTRRAVRQMEALGEASAAEKPGGAEGSGQASSDAPSASPPATTAPAELLAVLSDPELWRLLRKLLVHHDLRRRVTDLAREYEDV